MPPSCCRCCLRYRSDTRTDDAGKKGHVTGTIYACEVDSSSTSQACSPHPPSVSLFYRLHLRTSRTVLNGNATLRRKRENKKKIKATGLISTIWTCSTLFGRFIDRHRNWLELTVFNAFVAFIFEIFVTFIKKIVATTHREAHIHWRTELQIQCACSKLSQITSDGSPGMLCKIWEETEGAGEFENSWWTVSGNCGISKGLPRISEFSNISRRSYRQNP